RLITWKISGELGQLRGEKTAHRKNERESEDDLAHDCKAARHMDTLQYCHQRRQHEAEQNRQCNGHENLATEIKHGDNHCSENCSGYCAEQCHKFFGSTRFKWLSDHR